VTAGLSRAENGIVQDGLFIGIAALVWPVGAFHLALAARRSANNEYATSNKLLWFSVGLFTLAAASAFALIALTSLGITRHLWICDLTIHCSRPLRGG
jgi:hypothetical protein